MSNIATFRICVDATFFGMSFFSTCSPYIILIDATEKSKISSDHHQIFFDVSLYTLSFFASTPFDAETKRRKTNKIHALLTNNGFWLIFAFKFCQNNLFQ